MFPVGSEVIRLFNKDSVKKNIRVKVLTHKPQPLDDEIELTNENILLESVSFTESLCSQDDFTSGLAERSTIEFDTLDMQDSMEGDMIDVYLEVDASSLGYIDNVKTVRSKDIYLDLQSHSIPAVIMSLSLPRKDAEDKYGINDTCRYIVDSKGYVGEIDRGTGSGDYIYKIGLDYRDESSTFNIVTNSDYYLDIFKTIEEVNDKGSVEYQTGKVIIVEDESKQITNIHDGRKLLEDSVQLVDTGLGTKTCIYTRVIKQLTIENVKSILKDIDIELYHYNAYKTYEEYSSFDTCRLEYIGQIKNAESYEYGLYYIGSDEEYNKSYWAVKWKIEPYGYTSILDDTTYSDFNINGLYNLTLSFRIVKRYAQEMTNKYMYDLDHGYAIDRAVAPVEYIQDYYVTITYRDYNINKFPYNTYVLSYPSEIITDYNQTVKLQVPYYSIYYGRFIVESSDYTDQYNLTRHIVAYSEDILSDTDRLNSIERRKIKLLKKKKRTYKPNMLPLLLANSSIYPYFCLDRVIKLGTGGNGPIVRPVVDTTDSDTKTLDNITLNSLFNNFDNIIVDDKICPFIGSKHVEILKDGNYYNNTYNIYLESFNFSVNLNSTGQTFDQNYLGWDFYKSDHRDSSVTWDNTPDVLINYEVDDLDLRNNFYHFLDYLGKYSGDLTDDKGLFNTIENACNVALCDTIFGSSDDVNDYPEGFFELPDEGIKPIIEYIKAMIHANGDIITRNYIKHYYNHSIAISTTSSYIDKGWTKHDNFYIYVPFLNNSNYDHIGLAILNIIDMYIKSLKIHIVCSGTENRMYKNVNAKYVINADRTSKVSINRRCYYYESLKDKFKYSGTINKVYGNDLLLTEKIKIIDDIDMNLSDLFEDTMKIFGANFYFDRKTKTNKSIVISKKISEYLYPSESLYPDSISLYGDDIEYSSTRVVRYYDLFPNGPSLNVISENIYSYDLDSVIKKTNNKIGIMFYYNYKNKKGNEVENKYYYINGNKIIVKNDDSEDDEEIITYEDDLPQYGEELIDMSGNYYFDIIKDYLLENTSKKIDIFDDFVKMVYENISNIIYEPISIETNGYPFIELGDIVEFNFNNQTHRTIVLRRTISGIHSLTDKIESR